MGHMERYGIAAGHEISSDEGRITRQHEHPFYEIYFLLSGSRRYLMRHTVYDVAPRELVIVPRHELHRTVSVARTGYDRYVLYFTEERAQALTEALGKEAVERFLAGGCFHLSVAAAEAVGQAMECILREVATGDGLSEALLIHSLFSVVLATLRGGTPKDGLSGEGADKVQLAARYVFEHYAERITLAKAARMACLERTYFSRRFKQLTGFGFREYLLRTRLLAARRLLAETTLPLTRIAEDCGFESANYFGDVFRRYEGCSPSAYRRASGSPQKSPDFP